MTENDRAEPSGQIRDRSPAVLAAGANFRGSRSVFNGRTAFLVQGLLIGVLVWAVLHGHKG